MEAEGRFQLVRYSHIFASVVREVLEAKFLREVSPYPLTLSQFHLLKLIALNGGHQVGEVATVLGVSPPAATKNVNKLERLGLIVRNPSKGDRRATLLTPSAKGRRLVQKYEDLKADRLGPVLEEFPPGNLTDSPGFSSVSRFACCGWRTPRADCACAAPPTARRAAQSRRSMTGVPTGRLMETGPSKKPLRRRSELSIVSLVLGRAAWRGPSAGGWMAFGKRSYPPDARDPVCLLRGAFFQ